MSIHFSPTRYICWHRESHFFLSTIEKILTKILIFFRRDIKIAQHPYFFWQRSIFSLKDRYFSDRDRYFSFKDRYFSYRYPLFSLKDYRFWQDGIHILRNLDTAFFREEIFIKFRADTKNAFQHGIFCVRLINFCVLQPYTLRNEKD